MQIKIPRLYKICLIVSFIFAAGCASRLQKQVTGDSAVFFPPPPDSARIQFLTHISNSTDVTGQQSSFMRYVLGEEPAKVIHKPYGINMHDGKLYICDTMLPGLEIIDLQNNTFEYFAPAGPGQLKKPLNCSSDSENRLYVADGARRQVVVFDKNGRYLYNIGDGQSGKPTDVEIYQEKVWICDLEEHKIKVYDTNQHQLINSFPDADQNKPQYLFSPTNLCISDGKIYVTDTGDARIKVFNDKGEYIGIVGSFGKRPGQFVRPKGLAVDHQGLLFVADAAFEYVQIFNQQYELLMFFGGNYKGPGHMWLPAGIILDYNHLDYFKKYVSSAFNLKYLIFVSNQYGPDKINVYGMVEPR